MKVSSEERLPEHVNFGVVTYTGDIDWEEWQYPILGAKTKLDYDDDYNLRLVTPSGRGFLPRNATAQVLSKYSTEGPGLGIEFGQKELVAMLTLPPWASLAKGVHEDFCAQLALMTHGLPACGDGTITNTRRALLGEPDGQGSYGRRVAVILGTAGLDCVHECRMEIHPVYALAVRRHSKTTNGNGDEWWSIFVRNWATSEGQCSSHAVHRLPSKGGPSNEGQKVLLVLPPIEGVAPDSSTRIGLDSLARTNSAWVSAHPIRVEAKVETGTVLEFSLPPVDQRAIAAAYLHICRGAVSQCGVEQKPFSPAVMKDKRAVLPASFELSTQPLGGILSGGVYLPVPEPK